MSNLWGREPVLILAFIRAVLYGGAYFGLDLSEQQIIAIIAIVETALAIITRQNVVSPETHIEEINEALNTPPPVVSDELVTKEAAL